MNRDEWVRIKQITAEALERPAADRERYVADACREARDLELEVRSLLASAVTASSMFEDPVFRAIPDVLGHAIARASLPLGTRVGAYRIVREIGRGGMGTVFLAERADDAYRQRVALKVAHETRSPEAFRRFREERQILATLDHPNIARLLDGGTTDGGLPFLVMEYVEGVPVDEYAAARHLTIDERVALFGTICDAVDYAHRHLIVHRDIKPSNILVHDGVPKLLDFGIARLLDLVEPPAGTWASGLESQRLTPEYASPEQLQLLPVTTATDVYALGVLLFRLLTGRSPYRVDDAGPHALTRAICDVAPEPPSAVAATRESRRQIAGDLDAIVLTALRKAPGERYSSAGRLADDVTRYLSGLPVAVREHHVAYRVRKFVRRHRFSTAAAALAVVSLLGGLVSVAWQARETEQQRQRAQQHFDDVRRLANGLVFDINDGIEQVPGTIETRRLLLARALQYFDRLAAEEQGDVGLQRELAQSYERLGNVLGRSYAANLGDTGAALAAYRKSLSVRQRLAQQSPDDPTTQLELWSSQLNIGNVLRDTAHTDDALTLHVAARRALDDELRRHPADTRFVRAAAQASSAVSLTFVQAGRLEDALESGRRAVALNQQLLDADPANATLKNDMATVLGRVGQIELKRGDLGSARGRFERSFALASALVAAQPGNVAFTRRLSNTHAHLAQLLLREGDADGALSHQQTALALRQMLAAENPADKQASIDLTVSETETGRVFARRQAIADAVGHYQAAITRAEALVAADSSCVYCRLSLATALTRLAEALLAQGHAPAAEAAARRATVLMEAVSAADAMDVRPRFELAMAYRALGQTAAGSGAPAGDWYRKSLDALTELTRDGRVAGGPFDEEAPRIVAALERAVGTSPQ